MNWTTTRAHAQRRSAFERGPSLSASRWYATLLVLAIAGAGIGAIDEPPGPSEYQLKAAFLYNFAKFVEWPAESFSSPEVPFTIGVIGISPFEEHLEQAVLNKRINGHPFEIKQFKALAEARSCHMLFICASERRRMAEILKTVNEVSVLTVSELERFLPAGGMIQFVMEENKVRFDINPGAARRAHLRISSKLMSVARRIDGPKAK